VPDTAVAPNLDPLLDAYALLGLDHTANPRDARRAYRAMARRHHPDRVAGDTSARGEATARMAAINQAYELVRDAPLRHHPISRASDPDYRFTQAHTDEALRRARGARQVDLAVTAIAHVAMYAILIFVLVPVLHAAGVPYGAAVVVALLCAAGVMTARRSIDPLMAADGIAALVRVLLTR
jgi:preprotein translocase subunit Sec63